MVQAHSFGFSHLLPELPTISRNHSRRSWSILSPIFPEPLSLDNKIPVTPISTSNKENTDKMMWDSNNKVVPTMLIERTGDTYDMAYFLRTTGPPAKEDLPYEAREDRTKRKKITLPPMFRRKKDSLLESEFDAPRLTSGGRSPKIVQRVSKDGAKYLQIVTDLGALDSAEDLNGSGIFRTDSQRVSVSRCTSNLDAIDSEEIATWAATSFSAFSPCDDLAVQPSSMLEAKALPGSKPTQEYLSIKGPSIFAASAGRTNGLSLSMVGSNGIDSEATLIGEEMADMIARAAEMNLKDRPESNQFAKRVSKMASEETLATIRSYKSGTKRPRSEGEEHLVALQLPRDSIKESKKPAKPVKHHHTRDLSVLDLDAEFGGKIIREEIECNASRAVLPQNGPIGRDKLHRPPPLMLPPSLPAGSPFDSQVPTMVPELDRGMSSSESSTFGEGPSTPTPSPKGQVRKYHRKTQSATTPHRRANSRFAPTLGQPPHFLLHSSPPSSSRNYGVRSSSLSSSRILNTSFPAPPFPPPPPPPTMATPQHPNSPPRIPSSKRSSAASTATYQNSLRVVRLEARLESMEREKDLLEAALKAVLLTSGKLNKCPCSLMKAHEGERAETPSNYSDVTQALSLAAGGRYRRSDSVESTGSSMSALEVFMATRMNADALMGRQ